MAIPPPAAVGDPVEAIDTPALVLDMPAFERNLDALDAAFESARAGRDDGAAPLALRPHAKSHKCPDIARIQLARGAIGVCCQKGAEAEVFVEAGIGDVLITNELVGQAKAERVARLARRARVGVCVDHRLQVEQLGRAAHEAGTVVELLIELDVGQQRCGVADAEAAVALARIIATQPALRLRGLQAYHGSAQHLRAAASRREAIATATARARAARDALLGAGFACDEICGAGTGTFVEEAAGGVYTELQPGSYVFMDLDYRRNLSAPADPDLRQALFVLCSVISRAHGGGARAILDAGLKAFAVDSGAPEPLAPGWRTDRLSDEHCVLRPAEDAPAEAPALEVGARMLMVPGHCDPTVNLHDWICAVRHGRVEAVWPVAARGALG
ncbi:MAG: DSD1 family PLP-dependent enzyme [Burkholderiales bacterium]|nr:MAG: DSD1 family PLP-dependent enzyme [Burkholderiales bacterium]